VAHINILIPIQDKFEKNNHAKKIKSLVYGYGSILDPSAAAAAGACEGG